MFLKKSTRHKEVCMRIANNTDPNKRVKDILLENAEAWNIKKTLIFYHLGKIRAIFWLNDADEYVYYTLGNMNHEYPLIGDLEHTDNIEDFEL